MSNPTSTPAGAEPAPRGPRFNPWRVYATALLACAALTAGGYAAGVAAAIERGARVEAERAEFADRRREAGELATAAADARVELHAARQSLAALPLHLEPATMVNARLAKITELANEGRLSVSEVRPGAVATDGRDFDTVPIAIAGSGSYPAVAAFLHRLHEEFPDTAVRSFRAAQAEGASAAFSFDLVWYTAKRK